MNNNLLDALKRLLADSIAPKDMQHFDETNISFEDSANSEHQKFKAIPESSLRILRKNELDQFTEEGLSYFYFIEKLEILSSQLREELLNEILTKQPISPYTIKIAVINMLSPQMNELDRLFLDFTLTPTFSTKH